MKTSNPVNYSFVTIVISLLICLQTTSYSQQDKYSEEITIIGSYTPIIAEAYKIKFNPVIKQEGFKIPELSYEITPTRINTSIELEPIKTARIRSESYSKLYRNYAKLGYGNYSTPLFEFYVNSVRNEESQIGLHLKHISSSGKIKDYANSAYSKNYANFTAKRFFKKQTLSGGLTYNRHVIHYYGFQPGNIQDSTINIPTDEDIKQRYQLFGGNIKLESNFIDEEKTAYSLEFKPYYLSDINETSEVCINVNSGISKGLELIDDHVSVLALKADINYYLHNDSLSNANDTINEANNGVININPSFDFNFGQYQLKIGFTTAFGLDTNNNIDFFPDIEARINVVPKFLTAFAGFTGGIKKASYRYLTERNPFISSIVPMRYIKNKMEIYGGIKGNIGGTFDYSIRISNAAYENMPFFIPKPDTLTKLNNIFTIDYDDITVTKAIIELGYQYTEQLRFTFSGEYNNYNTDKEDEAWYMPQYIFDLEMQYNISDRFIIDAAIIGSSNQYGKVYNYDINDYETKELNAWIDLNLGLEYRFTKSLSAFADLDNIANQQYQKWYNYPVQGFNFLGGLTYSF